MKYTSTTIMESGGNGQFEGSFSIDTGSETINIADELLTTYEVAKSRAESIFLEQGFNTKVVSIEIAHVNNMEIGDAVELDSTLYVIDSMEYYIDGVKTKVKISSKRWE